ncbi:MULTISPECIES: hypothetical protein [unclassified Mesorhizobium]|uniref:hypothetical protein n=1 Tax=unclassified Mesorhizobium TaxID=325217 RepID=UPI00333DE1A8
MALALRPASFSPFTGRNARQGNEGRRRDRQLVAQRKSEKPVWSQASRTLHDSAAKLCYAPRFISGTML